MALGEARGHEVMKPYHAYWAGAVEVLLAPFKARGRRREELRAGITLALSFDAWRTLAREQGLSDERAVEVALRLAGDGPAASGASRPPARSSRAAPR